MKAQTAAPDRCGTCAHYRKTGRGGLEGACILKGYSVEAARKPCRDGRAR